MPSRRESLSRADVLAIIGTIIAIVAVVFPMSWWVKALLLFIAAFLLWQLSFKSEWMIHRRLRSKVVALIVSVGLLFGSGWSSIRSAYLESEPPDVIPVLVYPRDPALLLVNRSRRVAFQVKWYVFLVDPDSPSFPQPLRIPVQTFDFIRPHGGGGPEQVFSPSIRAELKRGDQLFGYVAATCPKCATTREAWLYVDFGKGGWYAPLAKGDHVDISRLSREIPKMKSNLASFMKALVPKGRRIPIRHVS